MAIYPTNGFGASYENVGIKHQTINQLNH
jgi:hypothetical protein